MINIHENQLITLLISIYKYSKLPIKNEMPKDHQIGNANSAPTKSYLLAKVIITSVLSFIILITLIYFELDLAFIFK